MARITALIVLVLVGLSLSVHALPRLDVAAKFGTFVFELNAETPALEVQAEAGGSFDIHTLLSDSKCRGFIDDEATGIRVRVKQSAAHNLSIRLKSEERSSLILNAPDGSWHCATSNKEGQTEILLQAPNSGQLDIWAGSPREETTHSVTITIEPGSP